MTNTVFSYLYCPADKRPSIKYVVEAYKAEYGQVPDAFAALSYDATMMIIEAIKRAGVEDSVKVKDELAKTKDYQGVSGSITLDEKHNAVKGVVIIEMKNGIQAFKEKIKPLS